jgi:TetR/AcrR family transcriptional repressor of nem operon
MPKADTIEKPAKGKMTRERIIQKSAPVFNQHGYSGTSMAELMAATGLEKGGIYRHFDSKQSLAAAAFDYAWDEVFNHRQRGIEQCTRSFDKLLLFIDNFVKDAPRTIPGGCPLLNTAVDSDDGDPVLRAKARAALAEWRAGLATLVRSAQAHEELRSDIDADTVAVVIIAALEGAVMMSRLEKSRQPLRAVGSHLKLYLGSLRTAETKDTASRRILRAVSTRDAFEWKK